MDPDPNIRQIPVQSGGTNIPNLPSSPQNIAPPMQQLPSQPIAPISAYQSTAPSVKTGKTVWIIGLGIAVLFVLIAGAIIFILHSRSGNGASKTSDNPSSSNTSTTSKSMTPIARAIVSVTVAPSASQGYKISQTLTAALTSSGAQGVLGFSYISVGTHTPTVKNVTYTWGHFTAADSNAQADKIQKDLKQQLPNLSIQINKVTDVNVKGSDGKSYALACNAIIATDSKITALNSTQYICTGKFGTDQTLLFAVSAKTMKDAQILVSQFTTATTLNF